MHSFSAQRRIGFLFLIIRKLMSHQTGVFPVYAAKGTFPMTRSGIRRWISCFLIYFKHFKLKLLSHSRSIIIHLLQRLIFIPARFFGVKRPLFIE
uniref:Putative secreted protein n=1 Tax=Anopheles marajoara TaxID=58244 RepID=A0A2M4C9F6_9DIPT